jgi:hypothetical protein
MEKIVHFFLSFYMVICTYYAHVGTCAEVGWQDYGKSMSVIDSLIKLITLINLITSVNLSLKMNLPISVIWLEAFLKPWKGRKVVFILSIFLCFVLAIKDWAEKKRDSIMYLCRWITNVHSVTRFEKNRLKWCPKNKYFLLE